MAGIFTDSDLSYDSAGQLQNGMNKYLGTTYILNHKADFEPGRTSDFILMIKIEKVELSPNPVVVNGKVKISVTIVTHNYLNKNYTHKQLATYTHKQLKDRGTT